MKSKNQEITLGLLRVVLGLLFLVPGLSKLLEPQQAINMVSNLGFPLPILFGWVLILGEVIFGATVMLGFKTKKSTWPLLIIMLVATFLVVIPSGRQTNIIFHILAIVGLIHLNFSGPGRFSLSKD